MQLIQKFTKLPLPFKRGSLLLLAAAVGLGVWQVTRSQSQEPQYQTATVEKGTLIVSVSASGTVTTANNVSVSTQVSGVVKRVLVENNDVVVVGQKLVEVELDQASQQQYTAALAAYQSAQNTLNSARANLHTLQSKMFAANQTFVKGALESGIASTDPVYIQQNADWLAAEASYKNQQSVIAQAQTAFNNASLLLQQSSPTLTAPISGTVVGLSLQTGDVLSSQTSSDGSVAGQKVASVQTNATPTIAVNLTEIDVAKVAVGNRATITLDAYSGRTFTGVVAGVDTAGSVSSGVTTYPAVIRLDTQADGVYPNMGASANIITDTKGDVLLVPTSALLTQDGVSTVRVLNDGKVTLVTVETGLSSDTQIEIVSGLAEDDSVVTGTVAASNSNTTTSPFSSAGGFRSFSGGGPTVVRTAR